MDNLKSVFNDLKSNGATWAEVAAALNELNHTTTAGSKWTKDAARNFYRRYVAPQYSDRVGFGSNVSYVSRVSGMQGVSIADDTLGNPPVSISVGRISNAVARLDELKTLKVDNAGSVFIIPDVHEPFSIDGFAEWCRETADRWGCDTIVQIGDLVDNYASSLHEKDPDNPSANDEYEKAAARLEKWFTLFPDVIMTLGNHDDRPLRTAKVGGLSSRFVKGFREVWGIPSGWKICQEAEIDGVLYVHEGGGGKSPSLTRAMYELMPVVSGHYHTVAGVAYHSGRKVQLWGLDVGCGVNRDSYAMAYNKSLRGYMLGAGVVVNDNGVSVPHFIPFMV